MLYTVHTISKLFRSVLAINLRRKRVRGGDSEMIKVDECHLIDFNCILYHIDINVYKKEAV